MENNKKLDQFNSFKEDLKEIAEEINHDIQESDRKITMRELYETIGFECSNKYPDEFIDCWGWDKKGFRKLYSITTVLREVE